MNDPAVSISALSKRYRVYTDRNQSLKATLLTGRRAKYEDFWALRDVSLEIATGSTYGIIGGNGSGKSTLLKTIAGILVPDSGTVRARGRVAALLELGSGFHPELTGRENVYLNGSILGLSRREIDKKFDEIVDFSGVEAFIDQPVRNYSSGMYVRLAFSVAINVDPDVLLLDEILAVGDAAFQRRSEERFSELRRSGRTIILVSHAAGSMRSLCDEVAWLDHGRLVATGSPRELVDEYVEAGQVGLHSDKSGITHWGTGEVRILSVEILDAAGIGGSVFETGDQITFRLHFEAASSVQRAAFSLSIESADGVKLATHHSQDGGVTASDLRGRGYVDLVVQQLPLLPGAFDVSATVQTPEHAHVFDHAKHCTRLIVTNGSVVGDSDGYLALRGTWTGPTLGKR